MGPFEKVMTAQWQRNYYEPHNSRDAKWPKKLRRYDNHTYIHTLRNQAGELTLLPMHTQTVATLMHVISVILIEFETLNQNTM